MTSAVAESFRTIPLKQLREAPWNPRKTFEKKALEELTASVKAKGVLVPLLVRQVEGARCGGKTASGKSVAEEWPAVFEIVAGARRFRAARAAGLEEVPVIVRNLSDVEALETTVIENAIRADVPALEEAEGYAALLKIDGYDVQKIAAKTGHSLSHVYARLQLAKLIDPAKKALTEDQITAGHANEIARLTEKDQAEALRRCLDTWNPATVRQLHEWIERNVHLDLHSAPWKKDDAELLPAAGACLTCTKRTGTTPALFEDIKKKDTCTDRECFAAKRAAWIEKTISGEKEKSGVDLLRLSTDYSVGQRKKPKKGEAPPPLPASQWTAVAPKKKACEFTRPAIVVDGHHGNIGELKRVCTDPKCQVHRGEIPGAGGRVDDSWRKRQAAQEKKAKRERVERRAILDATLAKVEQLDDDDLFTVAAGLLHGIDHETAKNLVRHHGWPVKEQQYGTDYRGAARKAIEDLKGSDLARVVLEIGLLHALSVSVHGSAEPKLLLATAKRKGVDVAAVRKAAEEEEKKPKARKQKVKKGEQEPGVCRSCGCTEQNACETDDGPCGWADATQTLCTACAEKKEPAKERRKRPTGARKRAEASS